MKFNLWNKFENEKNTKKVCKFAKFLQGTMRGSLLPLFTTFQTDFKTRTCNLIGIQV